MLLAAELGRVRAVLSKESASACHGASAAGAGAGGGPRATAAAESSSHTQRLLHRHPFDPGASAAPLHAQSIAANSGLAELTPKPHPQRNRYPTDMSAATAAATRAVDLMIDDEVLPAMRPVASPSREQAQWRSHVQS